MAMNELGIKQPLVFDGEYITLYKFITWVQSAAVLWNFKLFGVYLVKLNNTIWE